MARRQPAPRSTKADVAHAALGLFAERGYASVTVDEIAARAGVTKGAFYYYFADKADVATDLWRELWQRLAHEAQQAMDPRADAVDNLRSCLRAMLDGLGGLGEARFFLREAWMLPEIEVAGRRDQEAAVPLIEAILREAAGPTGALVGTEAPSPFAPTAPTMPPGKHRPATDLHATDASSMSHATDASSTLSTTDASPTLHAASTGPVTAPQPTSAQATVEAAARVLLGAFAEAVLYILTTGQSPATLTVLDHVVEAVVAAVVPTAGAGCAHGGAT